MRLCELRQKEVINLCDCRRRGGVVDLVFDLCKGCGAAIVVPGQAKMHGRFGCDSEYVIPFECIKKVVQDIIILEIC